MLLNIVQIHSYITSELEKSCGYAGPTPRDEGLQGRFKVKHVKHDIKHVI